MSIVMTNPESAQLSLDLTEAEQNELEQCEQRVERHLKAFMECGDALMTISSKQLFRGTHPNFESYCRDKWGISRQYAYEIMKAATIAGELTGIPDTPAPANVAQVRPLSKLETAEERQEAWQEAVETAPEGKVTAAHVQAVVEKRTEPEKTERPATSGLLKKVSNAEPTFTSQHGNLSQECFQWLSHRQGNPITGTVPPPVVIDGEKWVCLTLYRLIDQGRDEARCVRALLLDDYIDAFYQTPAYVKPLWQSEWQEEVATGKRDRENVSYLKVHTNPYIGILVLLPEIKTFTCLRNVQQQPEVDPYEAEDTEDDYEDEEIVTLEDEPEAETDTLPTFSEPNSHAVSREDLSPKVKNGLLELGKRMMVAYGKEGFTFTKAELKLLYDEVGRLQTFEHAYRAVMTANVEDLRKQVEQWKQMSNDHLELVKEAQKARDAAEAQMEEWQRFAAEKPLSGGLHVAGKDFQLLTALAARKRPGQDAMEPAAYLSMLLEQWAEQAGIELEVSDGRE